MWRTGGTSEKCFTHYFAKILFWPLYWNLWETSHSLNLLRITFLVTCHDMGVPQQNNPTLLSSRQSPKPTFKVRWGPCLVSSQTHLQHSEWGAKTCLVLSPKLLIYATTGKFGQIANLQRVTCARQRFSISAKLRVHISKSLFRFVKDLHVFMMVQGRLYVEKKAFWKFFFFFHSFLSSQMNMFTFQIRVMLTDCWFKWCL